MLSCLYTRKETAALDLLHRKTAKPHRRKRLPIDSGCRLIRARPSHSSPRTTTLPHPSPSRTRTRTRMENASQLPTHLHSNAFGPADIAASASIRRRWEQQTFDFAVTYRRRFRHPWIRPQPPHVKDSRRCCSPSAYILLAKYRFSSIRSSLSNHHCCFYLIHISALLPLLTRP